MYIFIFVKMPLGCQICGVIYIFIQFEHFNYRGSHLLWDMLSRYVHESVGVSNHRRLDGLLNRFFRRRSKKTSKLRVSGLCGGNSPVTGEFPAQRANDAGNVSIWWRHHGKGNHECVQLIISPRWHYLWHSDETKCHRSWPPLVQLNSPPEPTLTYRQVDPSGLFLGR